MNTGIVIVVIVVALCVAFGVWRKRTDGQLKPGPAPSAREVSERLTSSQLGVDLGERATLVQFSTAFCQPCRATKRILTEVSEMMPGVVHVDIDAESQLELVRQLDVRRTPTVLIIDAQGQIRERASGLPRKADVIAALGNVV